MVSKLEFFFAFPGNLMINDETSSDYSPFDLNVQPF
jgi:hypothetical protein